MARKEKGGPPETRWHMETEAEARARGEKVGGESRQAVSAAELMASLKGIHFPASKNTLLSKAEENEARQQVITMLQKLPDREFMAPNDIEKEFGRLT